MVERILEPLALTTGPAARQGLPFQGGPAGFLLARLIEDGAERGILPASAIPAEWQDLLPPITAAPPPFAGLVPKLPGGPLVMGIVNVTPDSFSGDGVAAEAAIAQGQAMLAAGADILDIGGESTRPGAAPVPPEEEIARILPVVRALASLGPVSIDTRNAATMAAALDAGARIVNDIAALRHDPEAPALVRRSGAPVVLMHMLGTDPRTMQDDPRYDDVAVEVFTFLRDRIVALGLPPAQVAVDPGIGFGKTLAHNLALLDRLPILAGLGCPILLGASRKASLGRLAGAAEPGRRLAPSLAAALTGTARGAAILRVHDVAETVQALKVWRAATG
ncbi:dihydropteroate synthase [Siccirubricoccus sp. KC 17139]|uniref:dihydropteroate synthase n=1 Tax=Siccirubricoccus soli TaxID=2899147 RepID=A0ABT1DC72_9PROT|nr:dihydropteroate synthase [Siccirubricoccus soli]MCO6419541.1 dihydropteroate synthase [Siccirubricoccus soli]MCP2685676.1 dihydropteroate synthase [Siccirubricoccus soli]